MSIKYNILQKNKLLKAVRRRNEKVSNHNFETKTLKPVSPMPLDDNEQVKEERREHIEYNKLLRKARGVK